MNIFIIIPRYIHHKMLELEYFAAGESVVADHSKYTALQSGGVIHP